MWKYCNSPKFNHQNIEENMETIILNDPTQWKLFVIFLSMLWLGLLLWMQWRRILRVEGQLHKLQTAKVKPGASRGRRTDYKQADPIILSPPHQFRCGGFFFTKEEHMPNWCRNILNITGPVDEVSRFQREAVGVSPWNKNDPMKQPSPLNFHSLVPIPPEVLRAGYTKVWP
jgi:hypothetical protein